MNKFDNGMDWARELSAEELTMVGGGYCDTGPVHIPTFNEWVASLRAPNASPGQASMGWLPTNVQLTIYNNTFYPAPNTGGPKH